MLFIFAAVNPGPYFLVATNTFASFTKKFSHLTVAMPQTQIAQSGWGYVEKFRFQQLLAIPQAALQQGHRLKF